MIIEETCIGCDSEEIEFINDEVYYCVICGTYYDTEEYLEADFERQEERLRRKAFQSDEVER